jgi:hypothetical protein
VNQTAICNLALLRIGISQQIADITDNSTQARACNAVYENCVRTMLRERPWTFAVRQVSLSLVGENQIADWYYTYRYPTDYITVNRVLPATLTDSTDLSVYVTQDRELDPQTYPFKLGSDSGGRLIHTDVPDAIAEGTVYIADTTIFDPMFANALAWYIAAEIALSLTKNQNLYGNAFQQYQAMASEGFASGMNEQKPRESADADMVKARE